MTPWQWWAGEADNVEGDGLYEIDHETREAAIAWANHEYPAGTPFYVIEARTSTDAKYASGNYEQVPFVKTRNKERLIASAGEAGTATDSEAGVAEGEHATAAQAAGRPNPVTVAQGEEEI